MNQVDMTPTVRQRLLLDIMPFEVVPMFWEGMSLVPPGPDVLPLLENESNKRMAKVAPLAPVCEMYIAFTAEIITQAMLKQLLMRIPETDQMAREQAKEMLPVMTGQNREVVRASLYATLAHLIDSEFIAITKHPEAAPGAWPG